MRTITNENDVERRLPPSALPGARTQVVPFSGGPLASGANQAVNWLGATNLTAYRASMAGKLVLADVQLIPAGADPALPTNAVATFRVSRTRNGTVTPVATLVLRGNGQYQLAAAQALDLDVVSGDLFSVFLDAVNVGATGWWTALLLTFDFAPPVPTSQSTVG